MVSAPSKLVYKGDIPEATKRLVKKRQHFLCATCGRARPLEIHHLVARGMGGGYRDDSPDNLVGLCGDCHKSEPYSKGKFGKQDWRGRC